MSEQHKRVYSSDLRDAQARETRRQIVTAAGELYARDGFGVTTVDDIARAAGVSRKTVFTSVGGKVEILKLALDWALVGDDEPVPMMAREPIQGFMREADPVRILEGYAEHVTTVGARVSGIYAAVVGAAAVDPDARALLEQLQRQRLRGMRAMAAQFQRAGHLRDGLSTSMAADIIWLHTDPLVHRRLVHDRGWSARRFRDWMARSLRLQLLP
jgi:AcrR family transcriptional regulator